LKPWLPSAHDAAETSEGDMTRMRRTAVMIGVLVAALLPIAATVSTSAATPDEIPVAITQPMGRISRTLGPSSAVPVLPETGMMMLVGTGLLGLGTVARRSTRCGGR
jgi:hypothetical protein